MKRSSNSSKSDRELELEEKVRNLEKAVEYEKLRSLAYSTMIDVAEEYFGIDFRKKNWSQAVSKLRTMLQLHLSILCGVFGKSRQAYYQRLNYSYVTHAQEGIILDLVREYCTCSIRGVLYKLG